MVDALERVSKGDSVANACRRVGLSAPTFYHYRSLFGSTTSMPATNGHDERTEVIELRRLCAAQGAILKAFGLRVEALGKEQ